MVSNFPVFGTFLLHEIADDVNSSFLSDLRVFSLSSCRWSMAIMVCWIGTIAFPLSNIPPVSNSTAEDTTFLSVW